MQILQCDAKGRLYLKESIRARYGERFIAISTLSRIILLPVPKDPIRDLREAAKPLRGMSLKKLKKDIEQETRRQVVG